MPPLPLDQHPQRENGRRMTKASTFPIPTPTSASLQAPDHRSLSRCQSCPSFVFQDERTIAAPCSREGKGSNHHPAARGVVVRP